MFAGSTQYDTLEDFVFAVTRLATEVGKGFHKPDDDWAPVAIATTPYGKQFVDLIPMGSDAEKRYAFETMLPNAIRAKGISRIAMVLSSWGVKVESDLEAMEIAQKGLRTVSEDRKFEMLWVVGHESGEMVGYTTKIVRFPDRAPIIGAWEKVSAEESIFERWREPIQQALTDVATL